MNGFDALKTGRRVKLPEWDGWATFDHAVFVFDEERGEDTTSEDSGRPKLSRDDWEVEPVAVEITREKLEKAWRETVGAGPSFFDDFCHALGFPDE